MLPKFLRLIGSAILGTIALSVNPLQAEASQLKPTPNICSKNLLLQSAFFKQIEELCLKAEKPVLESNDSNQDTGNNSDKATPDKSKEESEPVTSDSGLKINVFFNFGGSNGEQFGIGDGFTSPQPIPARPYEKTPKKIKEAKPQKLVSPNLNRDLLLPQKGIKPISPKYSPNIKSLNLPTKSVRPILNRQDPALRIRSVQPMMKQHPMINHGVSNSVRHRSK
jgi:hypothetical protein